MDARTVLRSSFIAMLAVSSPLALVPGKLEAKSNDACATTGFTGCCFLPGSWCNGLQNKFWWDQPGSCPTY